MLMLMMRLLLKIITTVIMIRMPVLMVGGVIPHRGYRDAFNNCLC